MHCYCGFLMQVRAGGGYYCPRCGNVEGAPPRVRANRCAVAVPDPPPVVAPVPVAADVPPPPGFEPEAEDGAPAMAPVSFPVEQAKRSGFGRVARKGGAK